MNESVCQRLDPEADLGVFHEDAVHHSRLIDYWNEKRGDADLPDRTQIDPVDLSANLPYLALIERVAYDAGHSYHYRLAGRGIVRLAGRDPSGKSFHQLYRDEYLARAIRVYDHVAANRKPFLSRQFFRNDETVDELLYSRLILPLTNRGRAVEIFLLHVRMLEHKPGRSDYFF